ncbi:MAG: rRNA maturation RNase YbeY [Anaerolineae bacterium]|nr:rRNA maturation RNase YbeY [Anaerolineae bacterium]
MSQIQIHLQAKAVYRRRGLTAFVRNAVNAALAEGKPELLSDDAQHEVSIVLSDDAQLQTLNRDYRGQDKPTDVLSFEGQDPDGVYLGDIIISMQRCAEQASEANHSLDDELALLVIHGVLHLVGYDHATDEERDTMWRIQRAAQQTALARTLSARQQNPD